MKTNDKWERLFIASWLFVLCRMRTPEHLQTRNNVHKIPYEMGKLSFGRITDLRLYAGQLDAEINKITD